MDEFDEIDRRRYLEAVGTLGAGATLGVPGCTDRDDDSEANETSESKYAPVRTPSVDEIPEGGTGENFELVGHNPLYDDHQYGKESLGIPRGSNGDITIAGDYVYVGSFIGHQPPLIVDVSDPTDPDVVGPVPNAVPGVGNGIEGIEASGDVLVIDQRRPLAGMGFDVPDGMPERGLAVYDVSTPRKPELVARYDYGSLENHALSLWRDPEDPDRLLGIQTFEESPHIQVVDLTGCPADDCEPEVIAKWDLRSQIGIGTSSHEAIMSVDGERIYVAQRESGVLLLDSSNLLTALRTGEECETAPPESTPGDEHCLTAADPDLEASLEAQPDLADEWHHTPLKVPDRPYLLTAAESTGVEWDEESGTVRNGSCPGAKIRVYSIDGNRRGLDPDPEGTYSVPEQNERNCDGDEWKPDAVAEPAWLSPHLPLAFHDLAFSTYYSAGFRGIDISDPADPREVGRFFNEPVEEVRWASYGLYGERERDDVGDVVRRPLPRRHMLAFSTPVVYEGYLIYADVHSGLYVLEYTGPYADQVPNEELCHPANPGAVEPGYEPCPPYGEMD